MEETPGTQSATEKVLTQHSKTSQQLLEQFDITSAGKFVQKRRSQGFILDEELLLSDTETEPPSKRRAVETEQAADSSSGKTAPVSDRPADGLKKRDARKAHRKNKHNSSKNHRSQQQHQDNENTTESLNQDANSEQNNDTNSSRPSSTQFENSRDHGDDLSRRPNKGSGGNGSSLNNRSNNNDNNRGSNVRY